MKGPQLSRTVIVWFIIVNLVQACSSHPSNVDVSGGQNTPSESTPENTNVLVFPRMTNDYLVNPGIGWQTGPKGSDGVNIPETVAYSDRREIAWKILNPEEGIYDWSELDDQLATAVASGKQYSFRVYTMVGEPFGGHMVPDWALKKGARILSSGEPDYSNCVYQEEWGRFVEQLILRYDGNPDIAFIDISGYGNFNEWSWQDAQTKWEPLWAEHFATGTAMPEDFKTLDGQARRRLADIFIGGSFPLHTCQTASGTISEVPYSYPGFQRSQLLMPYAGIAQSTQYVFTRKKDVGFRYDCLGAYTADLYEKVGNIVYQIWPHAPVVYELCSPDLVDIKSATWLLQTTHGSLVHDNASKEARADLEGLVLKVGYRYFLREADLKLQSRELHLRMEWQNIGLAPSYPGMGQSFTMMLYLVEQNSDAVAFETYLSTDIASWLPVDTRPYSQSPGIHVVDQVVDVPVTIQPGAYRVEVAILDVRTDQPVRLAMEETESDGRCFLTSIMLK